MTDTPKPRSPAWVRVLLVASLAINFVFVGLASGIAFNVAKGSPPPGLARLIGPLVRDVPPELRTKLRREVLSRRADLIAVRNSVRQSDETARMALVADPFDINALETALVARAAAVEAAMLALNEPILSLMPKLTQEERLKLAEALAKHREAAAKDEPEFLSDETEPLE